MLESKIGVLVLIVNSPNAVLFASLLSWQIYSGGVGLVSEMVPKYLT
jgi:hypothetical protein